MVNIIVNGIGTIGKRVAHAVKKQDDLELYGLSDVSLGPTLRTVLSKRSPLQGTDVFCSVPDRREDLENDGVEVKGMLEDVLESGEVDLVVDSTPAGVDERNKPMYEDAGVRAVFQGGADASIAPVSFNALANYKEARDRQFVRVVSCNTTSLTRTHWTLDDKIGVERSVASLVRRAGDPPQDSRGPVNSIVPVDRVPSHHAPDVQEIMPELDITTLAVKVPTTLSHVHMVNAKLGRAVSEEEIEETFRETPRIRLFRASEGYDSTSKIIERFRDLRLRYDMPEVAIWEETVKTEGRMAYWIHQVHQESIVVPENIDAIRSMMGLAGRQESIRKTDKNLGID